MARSTTPTPATRADWTDCGGCTSGSTALRSGATSRACGGAGTTSTSAEPDPSHGVRAHVATSPDRRLRAAVRRQRGDDGPMERIDVGDGRDADARRLVDVDDVDADVRSELDRRHGF